MTVSSSGRRWWPALIALGALATSAVAGSSTTRSPQGRDTSGTQPALQEVVQLRSLNSTTYQLPDGNLQAEISIEPQHHALPNGQLVPIDTSIIKLEGSPDGFALANEANSLKNYFDGDRALVRTVGSSVGLTHQPTLMRYSDGRNVDRISTARARQPLAEESKVTYPDVLGGVDVVYNVRPGGVTKEFVLDAAPRPPAAGFDPSETWLEIGERLSLDEGAAIVSLQGKPISFGASIGESLLLRGEEGRPLLMSQPLAFESPDLPDDEHSEMPVSPGQFWIESEPAGSVIVWTRIPYAWISAPDRAFPVIIDPTLDEQPAEALSKDAVLWEWSSGQGSNNGGAQVLVWGSGTIGPSHGMVQFDLSAIPSGASVSQADLDLGPWSGNSGSTGSYQILENLGTWTENTVTWLNRPPVGAAVDTQLHTAGAHQIYDVTSSVGAMVGGSLSNNGWRVAPSPTGSAHTASIGSSSDSATNRPRLIVTYGAGEPGTLEEVIERLDRIEDKTDAIEAKLDARLDVAVSSRSSQTSVNNVQNSVNALEAKLDARLDVAVSTRASQTSVNNVQNAVNAVEAKLDARLDVEVSTRATQVSVDQLTNDVSFLQDTVDVLREEVAATEAKLDELLADDREFRIQIENALQADQNTRRIPSYFYLPEAFGGMGGLTIQHLGEILDNNEAAGCVIGVARASYAEGLTNYAAGRYRAAWGNFSRSYADAVTAGGCN